MTSDKACAIPAPHVGHFWNVTGWRPMYAGDKQYLCPGVEDPALKELTDDQLRLAQRELERREVAAQQLRAAEQYRHHQLAEAELARSYQEKLETLLVGRGIRPPPGPGLDEHQQWQPVLAGLLAKLSDLMYDYRDEQENL